MTEKTNNVVHLLDRMHPIAGDVYEIDDDVLVLILNKTYEVAQVRLLTSEAYYHDTMISINTKMFTANNHVGNYNEIMSNNW